MAWEGFVASDGLGVGTGGFAGLYGTRAREYPHNLILEVAVEQGILGLAVLMVILSMTLLRLIRVSRKPGVDLYGKALLSLWFYGLFNALVSGDIATNQILWVTAGMVWLVPGQEVLSEGSRQA